MWGIMRRCLVVGYRRFGTNYWPHLKGSGFFKVARGRNDGSVGRRHYRQREQNADKFLVFVRFEQKTPVIGGPTSV